MALMKGALGAARDRGRRDVATHDPLPPAQDPAFGGALTDSTILRVLGEATEQHATDPKLDEDDAKLEPLLERWIAELEALSGERSSMADEARGSGGLRSRFLTTIYFYLAVALGLAKERLKAIGTTWDLDDLDDVDYREWLSRHGASDHTLSSPIAFTIPNILFAYPDGDSTEPPRLSAASWLNWVGRSLLGRGEYFWYLAAGTGETVMLPLYLALERRGVRFEFFHKLVGMRSDGTGDGEPVVEELHFDAQAQLAGSGGYDPLVKLPGKSYRVWPSQPRWEKLDGVEKSSGRDFEAWETDGFEAAPRTLKRGEDFDYVVWAMPPSMIPLVGDDRMQTRWAKVNRHLTTTATQAVQLWLTKDTNDLGWSRSGLVPATARYASGSFPNPLSGCVAFDDLIEHEAWPDDGPKGLIYLCSQLHRMPGTPSREQELIRIRSTLAASLRLMGNFLSAGRPRAPQQVDPQSLDFDLLYDPTPGHTGIERLAFQYVRANTRPTEAYVQAPPGSLKGRLDAWDSGYANLVPAGDWIRTGFNLGSFESAVTGGKLAAFALTGTPTIDTVVGYRLWHGKAGARTRDAVLRGPKMPVG
jgi:hypothetical protein